MSKKGKNGSYFPWRPEWKKLKLFIDFKHLQKYYDWA